MARPTRPNIPGGIYHVMSRGNDRKPIFVDDHDRAQFMAFFKDTLRRQRWSCLAYCQMGNHYHLLIQIQLPNLSRGMQILNGRYASWFNRRHPEISDGHLFKGRFRHIHVKSDEQFVATVRYIMVNPVAGGLCSEPGDWPWSSHRAMTAGEDTDIVAVRAGLDWFGQGELGRTRFLAFLMDGDTQPLEKHFRERDYQFAFDPSLNLASRPGLESLLASNEGIEVVASAYHDHGYSLTEIGSCLGVSPKSLSRHLIKRDVGKMLAPSGKRDG